MLVLLFCDSFVLHYFDGWSSYGGGFRFTELPNNVVVCSSLTLLSTNFQSYHDAVSGCDREFNTHFYSAVSLMYHAPDTWHDTTTPNHIILTLGRPVLVLPGSLSAKRGTATTILTTLVCRGPGSNPWPLVPRSGHSTYWAIGASSPSFVLYFFSP